ncbi:MAG: MarR family transcriptional regulator [Myxococcales bacterium]|nr:MarR family transcriptional regulator [Myxococcales bacterium]
MFDQMGLQRMMGRIVGMLLICDPPHQSSAQIAEYLDASRGSVSTMTRQLVTMGMIQRHPVPNTRASYFRIEDNAWPEMAREDITRLRIFRELAEQGLGLLAETPMERQLRLKNLRDFYAYLEQEIPAMIDRWDALRSEEDTCPGHCSPCCGVPPPHRLRPTTL